MRRLAWFAVMVAAAVLGGCGSDDDNPVKPPGPKYPELTSPQNVLQAMQIAYQTRDSVETKLVYDTNYVGKSEDLSNPAQSFTFSHYDEVQHVATLAQSSTISSVVLDMGPISSWTRLSSDDPSHPEWAMISISYWLVEINDGSTVYQAPSTNPMVFAFTPTVAAPGDTTWTIVRWSEIGSGI